MDLTEMLDNLALDLKVTMGTEVSVAEGTRGIVRAVNDLSRHIPREKIYEVTYKNEVTDNTFVSPAAQSDTSIVNAMDISASVDGATATLASRWNDIPRPVKVTLTDANNSVTRLTVIVKGTDVEGKYIEERFYRAGGKVQTGKMYFWNITEVELNEVAGNGAADTLSVGTGAITDVWIQLDYPIYPESEGIYTAALKAGTKFVLDTGYEMDYANGRISLKVGTTMTAGTTYYANYTKSKVAVDISAIIPEATRIVKVLYPADKVPEQSVAFGVWENMLVIGSQQPKESQSTLADGEHLAIYYECKQSPPTSQYAGSYPEHLDQVVLIGAGGYVLLVEALQHEFQAATDLTEARTTLGYLGTASTLVYLAVENALTDVEKYLDDNSAADAAGLLQDIVDNIAELRTKIITATGAMATDLAAVITIDLDQATVGASGYLATGDDLINTLPTGKNVPEIYAQYSGARTQIAQMRIQAAAGLAQEVAARISDLQAYIDTSGGYVQVSQGFMSKAQGYVAEMQGFLAEAAQYQETVANDMLLSDRFRAEAQNRLNEFHELLRSRAEYRKRIIDVPVRQPK